MNDLKPDTEEAVAPGSSSGILVTVLYGTRAQGVMRSILIPLGATVMDAIEASRLMHDYPELRATDLAAASHGHRLRIDAPVRAGQRIEILRPLLIGPKEARRQATQRVVQRPGSGNPGKKG